MMKKLLIILLIAGVAVMVFMVMRGRQAPDEALMPADVEETVELIPAKHPETFAELQAMMEEVEQPLKLPNAAQRVSMERIVGQSVRPANIVPIPEMALRSRVGDRVTIEAKVMGSLTPFDAKEASFLVGDEMTIASCDLISAELCTTPWDVHQEEPEAVRKGTAVIQLAGDDGTVIPASAKHVAGLKELRRLRIEGKIIEMKPGAYPVIQAAAIQFLD